MIVFLKDHWLIPGEWLQTRMNGIFTELEKTERRADFKWKGIVRMIKSAGGSASNLTAKVRARNITCICRASNVMGPPEIIWGRRMQKAQGLSHSHKYELEMLCSSTYCVWVSSFYIWWHQNTEKREKERLKGTEVGKRWERERTL